MGCLQKLVSFLVLLNYPTNRGAVTDYICSHILEMSPSSENYKFEHRGQLRRSDVSLICQPLTKHMYKFTRHLYEN